MMDIDDVVRRCLRKEWGRDVIRRFGPNAVEPILREELKKREGDWHADPVGVMSAAMVATLRRCKAQGGG